ncbi:MAG TPA: ADP-ribosylglycohydrolase family protein [Steroidobacteraceae bacterium]|nr:ADP-ribosylglycohydrolase family protein [Steroidobacteraceae bacterium]
MSRRPQEPAASAPLPNSYWVLPGRLLAGEHPQGRTAEETRSRLARLIDAGIDCFVDLTAPEERTSYDLDLPFRVDYARMPIRDHSLPARREHMVEILETIARGLRDGRRVYVHCRAGIGRTGTVIGCLMVERGLVPDDALYELNRLWQSCARSQDWPYVPETDEQIDYVRAWQATGHRLLATAREGSAETAPQRAPSQPRAEARSVEPVVAGSRRDRFIGALVGLAIGDALAARGGDGMLGAWTDDTSMALCLAESLLESDAFDPHDQVSRYTLWQQSGHLSATGQCVGITASTARALAMAQWRRQMFSGSHDPNQLDPEPLARVAPAVMFGFDAREEAIRQGCDAARTTCQAPLVLDACLLLAVFVHAALEGRPKAEVFAAGARLAAAGEVRGRIRSIAEGSYRADAPTASAGQSANAPDALEAALRAFERSRGFEDGALRAAAAGASADVVAAVYGQLAGAHFGLGSIPPAWRNTLMHKDLIEGFAGELCERSLRATGGRK